VTAKDVLLIVRVFFQNGLVQVDQYLHFILVIQPMEMDSELTQSYVTMEIRLAFQLMVALKERLILDGLVQAMNLMFVTCVEIQKFKSVKSVMMEFQMMVSAVEMIVKDLCQGGFVLKMKHQKVFARFIVGIDLSLVMKLVMMDFMDAV